MKSRSRLYVSLCCLGGLLFGSAALGQQDPRGVIVKPSPGAKGPAQAKRYWADYAGNAIKRSNLDGSNVETVAADASTPYATTYDPETAHILWTNSGDELVQMAPASGSSGTITLNSSFEESFTVVIRGTETHVAYGVVDGQLVRHTENRNTGAEQREVLYTLSSPEDVHGLALTPDNTGLYLGDVQGRMTRKLNLSTLQVQQLVYDNEPCSLCVTAESTSSKEPSARKESTRPVNPNTKAPAPAAKAQPSSKEKAR